MMINFLSVEGYTVKKVSDIPPTAGMSLTKLSQAGKNKIIPRQEEFG